MTYEIVRQASGDLRVIFAFARRFGLAGLNYLSYRALSRDFCTRPELALTDFSLGLVVNLGFGRRRVRLIRLA